MKSYYFTEEHELFRQSLRDFLNREVKPYIDEWEEKGEIPREIYNKFGEMGYFGIPYPEAYGGLNLDHFYEVVLSEELARVNSGGFGAAMGSHSSLALTHINAEGNEAQKQKYLVPGIKGEIFGCLAITEPGGGSDVAAVQTKALKEGNDYVINGSKTFITNGVNSDFLVVACRTNPDSASGGISMILLDRDTPGISARKLNKLGWRCSDTGEISFDDVRVPQENLLGEENKGFYYIMQHFASERLMMAVSGYAVADYALEVTRQYISERNAFGRSLNKFQVLRHRIAQMYSEVEMVKQFTYSIADRYGKGDYIVKEAAMAKLLGTQLCDKVVYDCLQMYGGYGFMEDYPLARMFRDSRLGTIGGGSSEILCEIISKMTIDQKAYSKAAVH